MKRSLVVLLVVVALVAIQRSVLASLLPEAWVPHIFVMFIVTLGFHESSSKGALLAFLSGLFLDMYDGRVIGPFAGASVAVFCLISSLSHRLFVDSSFATVGGIFIGVLVFELVYLVILASFQPVEGMLAEYLAEIPLQGILSGVVGAVLFVPIFSRFLTLGRGLHGGHRI